MSGKRLELRTFDVERVAFGERTALDGRTLTIDRDEIGVLAASDPAFAGVDVQLVRPGEAARIPQITDVVEPRVKSGGPGGVFPGLLSPVEPVGSGRTDRLRGVAVVTSGEVPWLGAKGLFVAHDSVLDTAGPGADLHPYAGLHLLVLRFRFAEGVDHEGYERAILLAGEKVARALALTAREAPPTSVETRELGRVDASLPRVVYAYQVQSQGVFLRSRLYGRILDELMPVLVHPNELADGALTSGGLGGHGAKLHTWMHQNNAVVEGLIAGHGSRWEFAGVVVHRGHYYLYEDKQRVGLRIAESAALLGAQGAVFTLGGAGNNVTEVMLAIQECERRGIKTVLITWEHAGPDGSDYPLPFAVPEAVAIVSTGNLDEPLSLPAMDRVVGDSAIRARPEIGGVPFPIDRAIVLERRTFYAGAANPAGFGRTGSVES
ncbi:MAG TPA: glycine/sarcosine/betaine reductase component B subunit [Candidatus Limnocylindria bacterium]|nr:glycine/sarcosine/betaine reductase component B subunit [Candidatus Limnocylindria bacterium]